MTNKIVHAPTTLKVADLDGPLQVTLSPAFTGAVDAGMQFLLRGSGILGGLPRFTATGRLRTTGLILKGHAEGEMMLTNAKGSITLKLEGPTQSGFAPLPHSFHFSVTGGTGAYRGVTDHGEATLRMHYQGGKTTLNLVFD
jgi:hypothetical protein